MDPNRPTRLLDEWDAIARTAERPATAPGRVTIRGGMRVGAVAPLAAAAIVVVLAVAWLGSRQGTDVGAQASASPATPSAIALASPSPSPSASPVPSATPSATPRPTPVPTQPASAPPAACTKDQLATAITTWDGAAGSRIATVKLRNDGAAACTISTKWRLELVDSARTRLAGDPVVNPGTLELAPGAVVSTLVKASNDCGPAPVPPVSIAFILEDGSRLVAQPLSPTDATIAPCNGPTQPGSIEMQPWTR